MREPGELDMAIVEDLHKACLESPMYRYALEHNLLGFVIARQLVELEHRRNSNARPLPRCPALRGVGLLL